MSNWKRGWEPILGKNREINFSRIDTYADDIWDGKWWFTPDPIVLSPEGMILNGQHRMLAVDMVRFAGNRKIINEDYALDLPAPDTEEEKEQRIADRVARCDALFLKHIEPVKFVLVTGVESRACLIMDEARRTADDRRSIAMKYAA